MSLDPPARLSAPNSLAEAYADRCNELSIGLRASMHGVDDIAYGSDPAQRLDVFSPDIQDNRAAVRHPVLIFLHGGGFTHGGKEWCSFMAPAVIAVPAVLVTISYRLMPAADYSDQLLDCIRAIGWVRANIAAYGGDPDIIFLGGHSAGGAIAAGVCLKTRLLASQNIPCEAIAGAVCLSTSFNRLAITGTPGADYELPSGPLPIDGKAPLAAVDGAKLPFFIGWGGAERQRERVERSSMAMISGLRDRGCAVEWLFLADADHFQTHLAFADPQHSWSRRLGIWIREVAFSRGTRTE
jgi:arylformamidase